MRRNILLIADFIVIGFTSIAAQTLFIRELEQLFYGNELCLGVIFAGWLFFAGIGCIAGRRIKRNIFLPLQFSLWFLLILEYVLIHIVKPLSGVELGELMPFSQMLWSSLFIFAPISFVLGLLFIQGCKLWASKISNSVKAVTQVYRIDTVGDLLGGIIFSVVLVKIHSISNIFVLGIINLIFVFILCRGTMHRAPTFRVVIIALLGLSVWGMNKTPAIERFVLNWEYPGYKVLEVKNSIYGKLVSIKSEGLYSVYQNGLLSFSYPTSLRAEEVAHLPMLQVKDAKNILFLGENKEVVKELLKYPVSEIHWVTADKEIGKLWEELLIIQDARVQTHWCDGRKFVKNYKPSTGRSGPLTRPFDLVIVDVGAPVNALVNRFYTIEFFQEVKKILNPDGVVSLSIESNPNYISQELLNYNGVIYATLKKVFSNIVLSPGDELRFFAADSSLMKSGLSDDAKVLGSRIRVPTKYVTEYFLLDRFQPERIKYIKEKLDSFVYQDYEVPPTYTSTHLNSDFHPIGYYYNNLITGSYFSGVFRKIFTKLLDIPFWMVLVVISAIMLGIGFWVKFSIPNSQFSIPFSIGILGCSGLGLQLFIILTFEVFYGYVYHKIGLITSTFMLGIVLGTIISEKKEIKLKVARGFSLAIVLVSMILFIFLLLIIIRLCNSMELLFYLLPIVNGLFISLAWCIANKTLINTGESVERATGLLNGVDLFGSCAGASLLSIIFFPIYGLYKTMFLLITLNFIAIAFNIKLDKKVKK